MRSLVYERKASCQSALPRDVLGEGGVEGIADRIGPSPSGMDCDAISEPLKSETEAEADV